MINLWRFGVCCRMDRWIFGYTFETKNIYWPQNTNSFILAWSEGLTNCIHFYAKRIFIFGKLIIIIIIVWLMMFIKLSSYQSVSSQAASLWSAARVAIQSTTFSLNRPCSSNSSGQTKECILKNFNSLKYLWGKQYSFLVSKQSKF